MPRYELRVLRTPRFMSECATLKLTHLCRRSKAHLRLTPSRRTKCQGPDRQHSTPSPRCRWHSTPPCSSSRSAALCSAHCAPWWTNSYRLQQGEDRQCYGSIVTRFSALYICVCPYLGGVTTKHRNKHVTISYII